MAFSLFINFYLRTIISVYLLYNEFSDKLTYEQFYKLYHHEILLRDVVNTAESVVVGPELTERIQALIDERLNELEKEINEKYGLTMKG